MRRQFLFGMVALLFSAPFVFSAPPGANDAKVEWDANYPKKENGKLKMKGTVTFAGGWSSSDGMVTITITPTAGGLASATLVTITNGVWEAEVNLTDFPNPKRDYDIVPNINAWKGPGTMVYTVNGARKTMELP